MINYYDLLKPAQKDYYSELLARRLRGSGGGGGVEEIEGIPPLTFQSDGTPLLDYLISGNTVQNGTPTPTNPIQPQSCGERTAQLIDYTQSEQGGIDASGNLVTGDSLYRSAVYTPVNTNIATWAHHIGALLRLYFYKADKTFISRIEVPSKTEYQIQFPQETAFIKWSTYKSGGINLSDVHDMYIMLNLGSTALLYEPYGYKIPILSNSTTTNVYLGEVQTTRKIKKLVLTGTESWITYGGNYYSPIIDSDSKNSTLCYCTHLISSLTSGVYVSAGSSRLKVFAESVVDVATTVSEWKAYLQQQYAAGTPVTIWYVLATPTTGIVNEPLMKIGDYADSIDKGGTGVNIPTSDGINTLSVNTSVQPSEVYIKYKK